MYFSSSHDLISWAVSWSVEVLFLSFDFSFGSYEMNPQENVSLQTSLYMSYAINSTQTSKTTSKAWKKYTMKNFFPVFFSVLVWRRLFSVWGKNRKKNSANSRVLIVEIICTSLTSQFSWKYFQISPASINPIVKIGYSFFLKIHPFK